MKELKFRVWDKLTKKMLTGFALFGETTLCGGIHAWQSEESGKKGDSLGRLNDLVEMQWTGWVDKNGNDIYDGDVLERGARRVLVFWDQDESSFKCLITQTQEIDPSFRLGETYPLMGMFKAWGVVSNIYESPEMV